MKIIIEEMANGKCRIQTDNELVNAGIDEISPDGLIERYEASEIVDSFFLFPKKSNNACSYTVGKIGKIVMDNLEYPPVNLKKLR